MDAGTSTSGLIRTNMNNVDVLDKVSSFMYNETPARIFSLVYDKPWDSTDSYVRNKISHMQHDFVRWYGTLDQEHRERLVKCAIDRSR